MKQSDRYMFYYPSLLYFYVIVTFQSELIQAEITSYDVNDLNVLKGELKDIILSAKREMVLDMNLAMLHLKQEMKSDVDNSIRNALDTITCVPPHDITMKIDNINNTTRILQEKVTNVHSLISQIKTVESNDFDPTLQNKSEIFGGRLNNVEITVDAMYDKIDILLNNQKRQKKMLEGIDSNAHIIWNNTQKIPENDYRQENKTNAILEDVKFINKTLDKIQDNVKANNYALQKLDISSKISRKDLVENISNATSYLSMSIEDLQISVNEVIQVVDDTHEKVDLNNKSLKKFDKIIQNNRNKVEDNNRGLVDINTKVDNILVLGNSTQYKVHHLLEGTISLENTLDNLLTLSASLENSTYALNDAVHSVDMRVSSEQYTVNSISNRIGSIFSKTTVTESGCIFPFRYKSIVYKSCTTADNNNAPWCSTKTNSEDDHMKKKWKYCQDSKPCVFPFHDDGVTYYSCTKSWCSTKTDGNNKHISKYWKIC